MIRNRLNGLANLHLTSVTVFVLVLLWLLVRFEPYLPIVTVSHDISLMPYLLCVGFGMALSGRFLHRLASGLCRMTWTGAAWLTTRQVGAMAIVLFAFMFAFKDRSMSRLFIGTYLAVCWGMLAVANLYLPKALAGIFFQNARRLPTLFVGSAHSLKRLESWLKGKQALGLEPVGFISLNGVSITDSDPPFLGGLPELGKHLEERGALQVILLEIPASGTQSQAVVEACQTHGARLLVYSNLAEQFRHPLVTVEEEGHQFYTLQTEPLEDPFNRVLKRSLDLAISLPVVFFVLPVLFVWVWLAQRLQAPGPVIFAQVRTGHNQRPFRLLKFRSMRVDNPDESRQASKGDPRIYPFGAFLRRTSLDEFPQFWNVLVGEMSLVGPRPHMLAHDAQFAELMRAYRTRFFVKPGITGLVQCNGLRGEITDPELLRRRVTWDLHYVNTWSIWMDVQLVVRTLWQVVFPPKSAY